MTPQDQKKRKTAEAAIEYIKDARVIDIFNRSISKMPVLLA